MISPYVELHARSAFSFLAGASLPEELVVVAASLGQPALALLDRDGLYGSPRFHMAAQRCKLKAHVGAEVTTAEGGRYALLVQNRTGYRNLCHLLTLMKLRAPKGQGAVTLSELAAHSAGLVLLTGGAEGPLARAIAIGPAEARSCINRLCQIFGRGRIYAELQRHHHRAEERRNQAVIELARAAHVPLLATNGVCYATPDRRRLLDVLTCLQHKTMIAAAGRKLDVNAERYLKSAAQMQRLFHDLPEAVHNTVELSAQLEFTLANLGYEFPRYPVPPGETTDSYLRQQTLAGMRERYGPHDSRAQRQIEHELTVIRKLGLAGYFLVVWDIVQYCREQRILVQGRGSAANSAVCYSLGITAVDSVGMDLLFERFLSEERGELPDIDLDLPSGEQREKVIQYLYRRYGERGAAMTANVVTYRGGSAARDVGKVLGFPEEQIALLSRFSRGWEWHNPKDTAERHFRDAGFDLNEPLVRCYYSLFREIQGLPRHLGQHSGGMVICQGKLDSIVPLEPASMPGRVVVQWDKDDCADLKLVKVDLLGLGMMAVLEESVALIRDHYGEQVDLAYISKEDKAVYEVLQKADTIGIFQVESRAQMATLPRLQPKKFYDIVVEVAIIRPGPIVGKMVHPYIRRRHELEPITYPHNSLEPILKRTLGLPLFQEQLLRMAMEVANFTGGQAEELRRAFGFKRSEQRMQEIEQQLRAGMTQQGIDTSTQETIIQSITSFALYGFPESHAVSFALLAYSSAYLKTHYLAAFTAAMLNNQPMGFYNAATLVKDAQRHGLSIKPVDVTISEVRCTLERRGEAIILRLGLNYIRGLRTVTAEAIVAARQDGFFQSVDDLVRRVPVLQQDELRQLASVGALNALGHHRRSALWQAAAAMRPVGPLLTHAATEIDCPLPPMTEQERMTHDYQGTGVHLGCHPTAVYRRSLQGTVRAADLAYRQHGEWVTVIGEVIVRQRPGTAKGFLFLSLEDETGISNVIMTPAHYEQYRQVILQHRFLLIRGRLQSQERVISVKAHHIEGFTQSSVIPVEW